MGTALVRALFWGGHFPPCLGIAPGIDLLAWQEPERHMEARCSKVEQAGEDPSGLPGIFAFSRGLDSS